jgi:membrane-associated phospholipid phosphatase
MKPRPASGTWGMVAESLARPYRVTVQMVLFFLLIPLYVYIASYATGRTVHAPAIAWDRALPLVPAWALVYGSLYVFLILLPVFVVRDQQLLDRTVFAYLAVWITAYSCFLAYPTIAPRPDAVAGGGFAVWGLRVLYDADPPYNCFPSLHVAHSFVSAFASFRVHRRVGIAASACALVVALSTLFTKQHYIADVVVGTLMALAAYVIFLRGHPRERVPELDRRLAPVFALGVLGIALVGLAGFWIFYMIVLRT